MDKTNYRVLKLKSGEKIMGQITESKKSGIRILNPMEIKQLHHIDTMGRKVESVVLSEWLRFTEKKDFLVERDHILGIFKPVTELVMTYEQQKLANDSLKQNVNPPTNPFGPMGFFLKDPSKQGNEFNLDNLLKGVEKRLNKMEELGEENADIDSEDFIQNLINRVGSEERLVDDESDPEYGSSYCDWSPNLDDYI